MPKSPDDFIEIAEVARAHGIRGELRVRTFSEESGLLTSRRKVRLAPPKGEARDVVIAAARRAPGEALLVRLAGIDDRDAADALRGAKLLVRRRDFPPLEEGEFYFCDLEGAEVLLDGRPFGRAKSVREYPTVNVLLVVPLEGGKAWEVPLTDAFVTSVDAARGEVLLHSIEGCVRE